VFVIYFEFKFHNIIYMAMELEYNQNL